MNDDFLHRIRGEPPPDFLARLKSRLDLQPPPTTPAARRSTFRNLTLGILISASVFAITLMILNRGGPNAPANTNTTKPVEQTHVNPSPAATPHVKPDTPAVGARAAAADVRATKGTPETYTVITAKSLQPYLTYLTSTFYNARDRTTHVIETDSASEAFAELCGNRTPTKPEPQHSIFALVSQRMTASESDSCTHGMRNVTEMAVGYQAIVLARSKLYGTFNLTPTDIFLALASEIPDPVWPAKLIPNTNVMWSDVNGALEREPIEVFGPSSSSTVGLAIREILLEAGCRALPSMSTVKKCPGLRSDGVYSEIANPSEVVLKLQTRPNAIGILPYGLDTQFMTSLAVGPIAGVVPSMGAISTGTYPGSRPLYLYLNRWVWGPTPTRISDALKYSGGDLVQRFAIIPPDWSPP